MKYDLDSKSVIITALTSLCLELLGAKVDGLNCLF